MFSAQRSEFSHDVVFRLSRVDEELCDKRSSPQPDDPCNLWAFTRDSERGELNEQLVYRVTYLWPAPTNNTA